MKDWFVLRYTGWFTQTGDLTYLWNENGNFEKQGTVIWDCAESVENQYNWQCV